MTADKQTSNAMRSALASVGVRHGKVLLAFAFAFAITAAGATYYTVERLAQANEWVAHTRDVSQAARVLLSEVQDAEIGQRGYLLTNDESYLDPFNRAKTSLPDKLANLNALTRDNPAQVQRLTDLRPVLDAKMAELENTVALAEKGQRAAAIKIVRGNTGRILMDDIRARIDTFLNVEGDLLRARVANAKDLGRWRWFMITLSLTIAGALAGILAWTNMLNVRALRLRTKQLEEEAEQRQRAEEALRQAQKLEAVGQLTGGIAHDFNNLLTIIMGNLDTIRRRLAGAANSPEAEKLASALKSPLESAVHGSRSAAQLTHRLLAFARRQPLAPARLDLNRLIADMSDLLNRTLGEGINVETVLAGGLWRTLADVNQLENALVNLSINARDAMNGQGKLTIETANTFLDDKYAAQFADVTPGQYVVLCVSDTGKGMTPDILEKVFEPFFTTKAAGEGSGLGLAMVHGFIKQSGGHIRIYSEAGHGTTVKIYLPRLPESDTRFAAPSANFATPATVEGAVVGETILVVEDNDGVREYSKKVLEELGYDTLEAADGNSAMEFITGGYRIDLLFTDVILAGGMNGRQLALKALTHRPKLPVLYTTGYTRNSIVHNGRLDPGVHLLSKPYTHQELAVKVRELIDLSKAKAGAE